VDSGSLKEIVLRPARGRKGLPDGGPPPLSVTLPVSAKNQEWDTTWQALALGN